MNTLRTDIDINASDMISSSLNDTIIRSRTDEKMREKYEAEQKKYYESPGDGGCFGIGSSSSNNTGGRRKESGNGMGRSYRKKLVSCFGCDMFCILAVLSVSGFLGVAIGLYIYGDSYNHFFERYLPESVQSRHNSLGFDNIFVIDRRFSKIDDVTNNNNNSGYHLDSMNSTAQDLKFIYSSITIPKTLTTTAKTEGAADQQKDIKGSDSSSGANKWSLPEDETYLHINSPNCWLPYLKVLDHFAHSSETSKSQDMLVLESNTGVHANIKLRLLHVLTGLPSTWDIIQLNDPLITSRHDEGNADDIPFVGAPLHHRIIRGGGCPYGGFAISKPAAKNIIKWLDNSDNAKEFSHSFKDAIRKGNFHVYRIYPPILKPNHPGTFK
ncbi:hypothetical protein H4219_003119 [Mycoemilia scoparia]|uniref:Uncharacterized protein n=1 Tax=Mycoemilia scoparia TaxID=417184 RepID=A0A9W8A549_9FUNG|nr:hypothetical protein H4219_003119 [Mycoemilia scoparia]